MCIGLLCLAEAGKIEELEEDDEEDESWQNDDGGWDKEIDDDEDEGDDEEGTQKLQKLAAQVRNGIPFVRLFRSEVVLRSRYDMFERLERRTVETL